MLTPTAAALRWHAELNPMASNGYSPCSVCGKPCPDEKCKRCKRNEGEEMNAEVQPTVARLEAMGRYRRCPNCSMLWNPASSDLCGFCLVPESVKKLTGGKK